MTVHTPGRRPLRWAVCKEVFHEPGLYEHLPGLEGLTRPLAEAVCAALEEARPKTYFITPCELEPEPLPDDLPTPVPEGLP